MLAHVPSSSTDAAQPRALIVTIYGLYARDGATSEGHGAPASATSLAAQGGGWLPVSLLVRLLAELGVDEPAVRSAISRLKRRGLLVGSRHHGIAGYGLSDSGDAILAEGDARIFAPTEPRLADGWLLAVFSVPEWERAKRHTLRTQLGVLGFGACAPGVWVAPSHRFDLTAASLQRLGLARYVDLFRAEYLAFGDIAEHARDWWDLDAVRAAYREFITGYPMSGGATPQPVDESQAFAAWVRALTAWRRLPYLDPGLPVELLPADWPAPAAREVFEAARRALADPAGEFVTAMSTLARAGGPPPAAASGY
jgi:phenylacetic acid degradation operon negative regulatory protein